MYDEIVCRLKNGEITNDHVFELYEMNIEGDIITVKYCGAWLVVENGYLNWSTTISPMKSTIYRDQKRWLEWLESMRKDIECTSGILKGCFRILNAGIILHGVDVDDKILRNCCAMQTLL